MWGRVSVKHCQALSSTSWIWGLTTARCLFSMFMWIQTEHVWVLLLLVYGLHTVTLFCGSMFPLTSVHCPGPGGLGRQAGSCSPPPLVRARSWQADLLPCTFHRYNSINCLWRNTHTSFFFPPFPVHPGITVNAVRLPCSVLPTFRWESQSLGWPRPCQLKSDRCLKIALLGKKPALPNASSHAPGREPHLAQVLLHGAQSQRLPGEERGARGRLRPPPRYPPSAAGHAPSPRAPTAPPRSPQGPAAPRLPPRGGERSAAAARWWPKGSGDAQRRWAAPPQQRGAGLPSAAAVGSVAAGRSGGVCVRRQRGPSAAPLRPPAPSHAVVMEEPRWRPWPTPGASGRSTTTSAWGAPRRWRWAPSCSSPPATSPPAATEVRGRPRALRGGPRLAGSGRCSPGRAPGTGAMQGGRRTAGWSGAAGATGVPLPRRARALRAAPWQVAGCCGRRAWGQRRRGAGGGSGAAPSLPARPAGPCPEVATGFPPPRRGPAPRACAARGVCGAAVFALPAQPGSRARPEACVAAVWLQVRMQG